MHGGGSSHAGAGAGAGAGGGTKPASKPADAPVELTDESVASLRAAGVFRAPRDNRLVSLDLHPTELLAVVASSSDSIRLYDLDSRKIKKEVLDRKRGVEHCTFTHHHSAVLYSGHRGSHAGTILYHSLHDNKLLMSFDGHKQKLVSLKQCPVEDWFLSTSLDNSLCMWDMRQSAPVARCKFGAGQVAVADVDPGGKAFGVALSSGQLSLFDPRMLNGGPFADSFIPNLAHGAVWTDMQFSSSGVYIALSNNQGQVMLKDAYKLELPPVMLYANEETGAYFTASFSADEKYLAAGCASGKAFVWNVDTQRLCATLEKHRDNVMARWHPTRDVLATAGYDLALWLPSKVVDADADGDVTMS